MASLGWLRMSQRLVHCSGRHLSSAHPLPRAFTSSSIVRWRAEGEREAVREVIKGHSDGEDVTVCGWVRTVRQMKRWAFVEVNDGSSHENLQLVIDRKSDAAQVISQLHTGASLTARGAVHSPTPGKDGALPPRELQCSHLKVEGDCDATAYPLQKKFHSEEFIRSLPHLRPRSQVGAAAARIRHEAAFAVHSFFHSKRFLQVHTPIITSSDCEGAGELFEVTPASEAPTDTTRDTSGRGETKSKEEELFFGRRAFLGVSGQLHLEAFACAMSQAYTFGPTFRAENSDTQQHLSEFWMIEAEQAFADLESAMQTSERLLINTALALKERCPSELEFLASRGEGMGGFCDSIAAVCESVEDSGTLLRRLTYADALKLLREKGNGFEVAPSWDGGLRREHELWLVRENDNAPLFVTDYPASQKPFYMRQSDISGGEGPTVSCMDLLAPMVGELAGGSAREEREELLRDAIAAKGADASALSWYLDLRRFGTVKHAGFGMGFERLLSLLSGIRNVRDLVPAPRAPGLCPM